LVSNEPLVAGMRSAPHPLPRPGWQCRRWCRLKRKKFVSLFVSLSRSLFISLLMVLSFIIPAPFINVCDECVAVVCVEGRGVDTQAFVFMRFTCNCSSCRVISTACLDHTRVNTDTHAHMHTHTLVLIHESVCSTCVRLGGTATVYSCLK